MGRRRFSGEFKARVAVEAIRGAKTAHEIAREHGVHPTLVGQWKRQALEVLPEAFARGRDRGPEDEEGLRRELYQRIGELQMELEWLKKNGGISPSRRSGR